jgi:hypothetical protein
MTRKRPLTFRRRGLAPLELVLAIPMLMFVVGLSVIIGVVACWKIRAETIARDAIFSDRSRHLSGWPDYGRPDPLPPEWRVTAATRSVTSGRQLTELDHPVFQNPLIRGPLPGNIGVNSETLDQKNHLRIGHADLTRQLPTLAKLGSFSQHVNQPLLDGKWQYWQLGLGWNNNRRLRSLYDLLNVPAALDEKAKYEQAKQQTIAVYNRPELAVLDRDDELFANGWGRDFHERHSRFCSVDTLDVQQRYTDRLAARIDGQPRPSNPQYDPWGVPKKMTRQFLSMYRDQLRTLQSLPPPLTAAQQAQIAALQQKIDILDAFDKTLN